MPSQRKRKPAREAGFFVIGDRVLASAARVFVMVNRVRQRRPGAVAVVGGEHRKMMVASSSSFMGRELWERESRAA